MITAVFDTVVLLQAAGKPDGPAGRCLRLVTEAKVSLFLSAAQLAEVEDVLGRERVRRRFPLLTDEAVRAFLEGIRVRGRAIADVPEAFHYERDPDDEPIVNLAITAGVSFLVTRDKDLLDLMREDDPIGVVFRQSWPALRILDPVSFLTEVSSPSPE